MEQFANTNAPTLFTQLLNSITNQARLSAAVSGIEPVLTPEINESINPEVSSQGGCPNSCERRISSLITNGNSAQSKERQGLQKKRSFIAYNNSNYISKSWNKHIHTYLANDRVFLVISNIFKNQSPPLKLKRLTTYYFSCYT